MKDFNHSFFVPYGEQSAKVSVDVWDNYATICFNGGLLQEFPCNKMRKSEVIEMAKLAADFEIEMRTYSKKNKSAEIEPENLPLPYEWANDYLPAKYAQL